MSLIKSSSDIEKMRESGRIVARTLRLVSQAIAPGVTPRQLNDMAEHLIRTEGGTPSFLGYRGYPAATCISVNQVVVHGIPNDVPLKEGDIVSLDFGVHKEGWHADGAWTFPVGQISTPAQKLLDVTREALYEGIAKARAGNRIGDIGSAVQRRCEREGFGVVRKLVGHGIGRNLHDEPRNVPMYGKPKTGDPLRAGMTICIEPMVNMGMADVKTLPDKWTVVTVDGKLAAHFEHTIVVRDGEADILTVE